MEKSFEANTPLLEEPEDKYKSGQSHGNMGEHRRTLLARCWQLAKVWLPIIGVFLVALAVRIIYNKTVAHNYYAKFDAGIYQMIAQNLLSKNCYCVYGTYVSVSRPPLWPWILTAIYFFTGVHNAYARAFYCVLGSGTCIFVYLFAKELFSGTSFGKYVAFLAGLMAAVYTGLFIYDGWLYSESLYTFCLIGFAYSLLILQRNMPPLWHKGQSFRSNLSAYRWAIACALFLAAAMLTRPNGASLAALVVLWSIVLALFRIIPWRQLVLPTVLIVAIAFLLVLPWTFRNYLVTGQLVLVSTGMGEVIKGAYNDNVFKGSSLQQGFWSPGKGNGRTHDETGYTPTDDKKDTAKGIAWIRSHLSLMPRLLWLHFRNTWQPYTYSHGLPMEEFPNRASSRQLMQLIYTETYPVYWLAGAGALFSLLLLRRKMIIVYIIVLYTVAQNVVTYGMMRFRSPIEPFLIILAGCTVWGILVGIQWLWSKFHHRVSRHELSLQEA